MWDRSEHHRHEDDTDPGGKRFWHCVDVAMIVAAFAAVLYVTFVR